jgi:hypothetical protein
LKTGSFLFRPGYSLYGGITLQVPHSQLLQLRGATAAPLDEPPGVGAPAAAALSSAAGGGAGQRPRAHTPHGYPSLCALTPPQPDPASSIINHRAPALPALPGFNTWNRFGCVPLRPGGPSSPASAGGPSDQAHFNNAHLALNMHDPQILY